MSGEVLSRATKNGRVNVCVCVLWLPGLVCSFIMRRACSSLHCTLCTTVSCAYVCRSCAGFFLVLAQPFRLGDKVAVSCSVPGNGSFTAAAAAASSTGPGTTVTAAAAMTSGGGYGQQHSAGAGARQATAASGSSKGSGSGTPAGWFEGVCEKVDLRYTVLR